ncbi:MAG TPA: alpha/beta fold hydrolase [Thermoanaerobaculia bacterium]|nr:alpha/beta fold hydrolase [Thermoanaerobaculia bacterium]
MANQVLKSPLGLILWALIGATSGLAETAAGTSSAGLFYEASGSGEPLVLIHAFSVDRRMWGPQVAAFEDRFRVIRYDLRGHGKSAAPTEPYTGYQDLRGLLDEMGIPRATIVGLSAGSELAINFALAHPDRVDRLVLAAPGVGGYPVPALPWFAPVFEALGAGDAERAARLWAETPIMALHANRDAAETVASLVMDNWRLWTYQRLEQPLSPPAVDRLRAITCPVLVVVGDRDLAHILEIARLIADEVGGATLVTIPGAGHIVNLDAPEPFNQAVATFLGVP